MLHSSLTTIFRHIQRATIPGNSNRLEQRTLETERLRTRYIEIGKNPSRGIRRLSSYSSQHQQRLPTPSSHKTPHQERHANKNFELLHVQSVFQPLLIQCRSALLLSLSPFPLVSPGAHTASTRPLHVPKTVLCWHYTLLYFSCCDYKGILRCHD